MKRYQRILVVVDKQPPSEGFLAVVAQLARRSGVQLCVATLCPELPFTTAEVHPTLDQKALHDSGEDGEEVVANVRAILQHFSHLQLTPSAVLIGKDAHLELRRLVTETSYDLLVKEAGCTPDLSSLLLGDLDHRLLREAPCDLLLVKPQQGATIERILAAVDATEELEGAEAAQLPRKILEVASSLAAQLDATLEMLHVWELPGESTLSSPLLDVTKEQVAELRRNEEARHRAACEALLTSARIEGVQPALRLINGDPADMIVTSTEKGSVQLVVMGSVGRTGLRGLLLGNVAEAVFDRLPCSLLAIKPPSFPSRKS